MQIKNKTMAIVITMILVTSMAISIGSLQVPTAKAVVINGINYDQRNCCRNRCRYVLEWNEL